jgi:hypothetical protein
VCVFVFLCVHIENNSSAYCTSLSLLSSFLLHGEKEKKEKRKLLIQLSKNYVRTNVRNVKRNVCSWYIKGT